MTMTPEKRYTNIAGALAKHLKKKPADILNVGYLENYNGLPHYEVMVAVDRQVKRGERVKTVKAGQRIYVAVADAGKPDDLAKTGEPSKGETTPKK